MKDHSNTFHHENQNCPADAVPCAFPECMQSVKNTYCKVTSSTEAQPHEVLLKTTKGYVYLSTQNMTDKQKHILKNLRPFQCLEIKTPEQFAMQNRVVRFSHFKIHALVEADRECRKIKVTTRIEIH